jgi:hypothetical protein
MTMGMGNLVEYPPLSDTMLGTLRPATEIRGFRRRWYHKNITNMTAAATATAMLTTFVNLLEDPTAVDAEEVDDGAAELGVDVGDRIPSVTVSEGEGQSSGSRIV